MTRASILSASLFLGLAACGGNAVVDTGRGGAAGTGPTGATTGTTATSTGSGTTSSGTTTVQGSTVTLTMDAFTVPSGGEVYYCQDFANPFGGADAEVAEFESHMTTGSHHMLLFYKPGATNAPIEMCSGLEFAATPYGSQAPDASLAFPPGVAALVPGTTGLRIQAHYLNTTSSTINAKVEVIFHLAVPGTVQNQAGVLFVVDPKFDVMPHSQAVVSDDCTIPVDMNLMRASSHMHRHGTNFVATVGGSPLYQTTTWSDPKPVDFAPPMAVKAGTPLHFSCTFDNTMGATDLTFGESALTNEMCIFTGSFYPTPPGQATIQASGCKETQM